MTEPQQTAGDVLAAVAQLGGLDARRAVVIRDGSNVMYRLPHGVVARIGRQGTHDTAARGPGGLTWECLSAEQITAMPVLQSLQHDR